MTKKSKTMEQQTNSNKPIYKRWWFWVSGIILLFILIGGSSDNNSQPSRETDEKNPADQTTSVSQEWHLVKSWNGTSAKKTEPFTITGKQWRIIWTNKDTIGVGTALLQVMVYKTNSQVPLDVPVNTTQEGSDTSYVYHSGEFYLSINSISQWTIRVEELR